ncbi:MAG: Ig-like domain-containing protein [Lachnospiraceae bacterium]|nr:Ig-like domain-containing protein [Lachnospiraceae bacterium]
MERVTEKRGSIFAALFMVVAMMVSFLLPAGEVQARVDSSKILYFGKYYLEDRNNHGSFYSMEFNELLSSSMSESDVKAYLNSHYGFDNAHGTMDYSTANIYQNYGSETINGVTYKARYVDAVLYPKVMLDYYHGVYYGSSADGDEGFRHYEFNMYCFSNMTDDQVLAMANNRYGSQFLRGLGFQGFQFDSNDHRELVPVISNKSYKFSYGYPLVRVENGTIHYDKYESHTAFLTESGVSGKAREIEASIQAKVPYTLKWRTNHYGDGPSQSFNNNGYPEESYVAIMVNDSTNSKGSSLYEECKNDEATVEVVTKVVPAGTKINVPTSTSKYDNVVFVKGYSDDGDFDMEDIPSDGFVTESGRTYYVTCLGIPKESTVKTTKVKSIKLSQTKATMSLNDQVQLTATVLPADATNSFMAWSSSNENVATVTANGLVTCVGPGNCKITATSTDGSKKKATCTITGPKQASSVKITGPKNIDYLGTAQLSAEVKPLNAVDKSVIWSIDKGNGEVDANGLVTCTGAGDIKVRATTSNGKKSTYTLKGPKAASNVKITGPKNIEYQGTAQLSATVKPDNAVDKTVTWMVEKGNGEVDANGLVTCTGAGDIKVRATTVTGKKTTYTLKGPKTASSVKITGPKNIEYQETAQLTATVKPDNAIDKTVTWSIDKGNGTVDANGLVTCTGAGDIKVRATAVTGKKTTYTLKGPKSAASVKITGEKNIALNGTVQLTATVKPDNAIDKTVTWEVEKGNGTVDANGLVTCTGAGDIRVKATAVTGKKGTFTIKGPKAATSVSVKNSSYKLAVGETAQPVATVNPKDVIDPNVTWSSSDPAIATVAPDGTITAVAPGKVTILATAHNGKVGKCTVTVKE